MSWKSGHSKIPQALSRYYDRGVTVFQKSEVAKPESTPNISPKTRLISVCVSEPPGKPRISRTLLRNYRTFVLENPGAKWKSGDLPKTIVSLLPKSDVGWWKVFAGGELPDTQPSEIATLLEWGDTSIRLVHDFHAEPGLPEWLFFSQPFESACRPKRGRAGPGACLPTCADPRRKPDADESGRYHPGACLPVGPNRLVCRLAMAAPRVEENGERIQLMRRFCSGGEHRQNNDWAELIKWRYDQPGSIPAGVPLDENEQRRHQSVTIPMLAALLRANKLETPIFWRACMGYMVAVDLYIQSSNRRAEEAGIEPNSETPIENLIPLLMTQVSEMALSPDCADPIIRDLSVTDFFGKVHSTSRFSGLA